MEMQPITEKKIKLFWLKSKEYIISNFIVIFTAVLILILTMIIGGNQQILVKQRAQKLLKQHHGLIINTHYFNKFPLTIKTSNFFYSSYDNTKLIYHKKN